MKVPRAVVVRTVWVVVIASILVTMFPLFVLPMTFQHLDQHSGDYAPAVRVYRYVYVLAPLLPVGLLSFAGLRFRSAEVDATRLVTFVGLSISFVILWLLWTLTVVVNLLLDTSLPL